MNLSQHPEKICVKLAIRDDLAGLVSRTWQSISGRHELEKSLQDHFYKLGIDAFVDGGEGTLADGWITLRTDMTVRTLTALRLFFSLLPEQDRDGGETLWNCVHVGVFDGECNLWRTFHPITTRPFWTLFKSWTELEEIMGARRVLKT